MNPEEKFEQWWESWDRKELAGDCSMKNAQRAAYFSAQQQVYDECIKICDDYNKPVFYTAHVNLVKSRIMEAKEKLNDKNN